MEAFNLVEELKKHNVLPEAEVITEFDLSKYVCCHIDEGGDFSINLDVTKKEVVDDTLIVSYQCVENRISNEVFVTNIKLGFAHRDDVYFNIADIVPWVYEGEQDETYFDNLWLDFTFVYRNQLIVIRGLGNVVFSSKIKDLPDEPMTCGNVIYVDVDEGDEGGIAPEKLLEYVRYWNK